MNDFNALLAQVIPVLLLAAAFESRWLQKKPSRYGAGSGLKDGSTDEPGRRVHWDTNPFQSPVLLLFTLFIGLGEALALLAVYRGTSEPWMNACVLLAGFLALFLVVWPLMSLHLKDITETLRRQGIDGITLVLHIIVIGTLAYLAYKGIGWLTPIQPGGR